MQPKRLLTMMSLSMALALGACGGGGGGGTPTAPTPPAPPASTYSVTLTGIQLERSADQQDLPVTGVPAEGATLTTP